MFRALNTAEIIIAAAVTAACLVVPPGSAGWALLALAWLVLAVQVATLRPRLDRRALAIIAGQTPSASRQHLAYVLLEGIKVSVLVGLGGVLLTAVLR